MPVKTALKLFALPAIAAMSLLATHADAALITRTYEKNLDNGNFSGAGTLTTLIDFNLDGTNDFSFYHQTSVPKPSPSNTFDYNGKLTMDGASSSQFLAVVKDYDTITPRGQTSPIGNYAETVQPGFVVGGNQLSGFIQLSPTGATAYDDRLLDSSGTGNGGAFSVATGERDPLGYTGGPVYVGFAYGNINNPNYGYLVFTKVGNDDDFYDGDRNAAVLSQIVYQSTPGTPITIPNVPEPTTLGAMAAAGLTFVRRRRA